MDMDLSLKFNINDMVKTLNLYDIKPLGKDSSEAILCVLKVKNIEDTEFLPEKEYIIRINPINDDSDIDVIKQEIYIHKTLSDNDIAPKLYGWNILDISDKEHNDLKQILINLDITGVIFNSFTTYNKCLISIIEYLKGDDYENIMKQSLSEEITSSINDKIKEKINKMHELNIIHNDLHEENIFIKIDGDTYEPYVIDFGLSQVIQPGTTPTESNKSIDKIDGAKYLTVNSAKKIEGKEVSEAMERFFELDATPQKCDKASWCCERIPLSGRMPLFEVIEEGPDNKGMVYSKLNSGWPIYSIASERDCNLDAMETVGSLRMKKRKKNVKKDKSKKAKSKKAKSKKAKYKKAKSKKTKAKKAKSKKAKYKKDKSKKVKTRNKR